LDNLKNISQAYKHGHLAAKKKRVKKQSDWARGNTRGEASLQRGPETVRRKKKATGEGGMKGYGDALKENLSVEGVPKKGTYSKR